MRSKPFATESAASSSRSSATYSNPFNAGRSALPAIVMRQLSWISDRAIAAPTLPVPPRMKAHLEIERP
jgi:hypothetical protein